MKLFLEKDDGVKVEISESTESTTVGAAATDAKADAIQVNPHDFVPNAVQMDKTTQRIYSFFNINEKIIQSKYDENEWISYFEAVIVVLERHYEDYINMI